jgi:hypothetical protein
MIGSLTLQNIRPKLSPDTSPFNTSHTKDNGERLRKMQGEWKCGGKRVKGGFKESHAQRPLRRNWLEPVLSGS